MNTRLSEAAESMSTLLSSATAPSVCCAQLLALSESPDGVQASLMLSASTTELANLLAWSDELEGSVTASVHRVDSPYPFVQAQVSGYSGELPVNVTTHLDETEAVALWAALGDDEPNTEPQVVSLDALRVAQARRDEPDDKPDDEPDDERHDEEVAS